jgi:hypothetical protein
MNCPCNWLWHFSRERTNIYLRDQQTALLGQCCETKVVGPMHRFSRVVFWTRMTTILRSGRAANEFAQIQAETAAIEISVIEGDGVCDLDA